MRHTLTILLFILPSIFWAQNVDFKKQNFPNDPEGFEKAEGKLKKGMEYFYSGPRFYERSLRYLIEANAFNPNNADLNYNIGTIYNALNLKGEAAEYYKKAASLNPKFKKEGQLLTAENYHLDMQWDRAIAEYNEYIEILNQELAVAKKDKVEELNAEVARIKRKIEQCQNGKKIAQEEVDIIIINLGKGVNSKYPDYSAVVSADEKTMYFTSRRANTTGGLIPVGDVYYFEDIYQSVKGDDGKWGPAKQAPGFVNTKDHEGTVALSADGKKMIIYRFKNEGDLYESTLGADGNWSLPKSLDGVNSKYRETHASYGPDGKTLYFTSNNPAIGAKGLDIFKSVYDEAGQKWGTPERLPETVNSDMDEDGVFMDSEGKFLYFSSKGRNTMGGYDIYKSEIVDGVPTEAVNMGYPVNTPSDDVFFVAMPGGKRAYFDSGRKGGFGEKDIYTMLFMSDLQLTLFGTIYDQESHEILKTANIAIVADKTSEEVPLGFPFPGDYAGTVQASSKYKATVKAEGYEDVIEYFTADMIHPDSLSIRKNFFLNPIKQLVVKGKVYDEETEQVIPADIIFTTVMGDSEIPTKSTEGGYSAKLDRQGVYKVKVSSKGYDSFEDIISLNEAGLSAKELDKDFYLLKTGAIGTVKDITLTGKIIDKTTGKATNGKIIIKDAKNKVVATLTSNGDAGYSTKIKSNTTYSFNIESEGYPSIDERVVIKVPKNSDQAKKDFYVEKGTDNVLAIRNIYFDFDKFAIKQESLVDLNAVLKIMNQYPDAKVELSGHTDSKGSYEYNLTLSLNRAKAAYQWLISNGISKNRITFTNYSFSKPAAPNENADGSDNPEGRKKNRRVEFRVYSNAVNLEGE